MRRRSAVPVGALVAVPLCAALLVGTTAAGSPRSTSAIASTLTPAGAWGKAEEVPGTAGLNAGGSAAVESLFCSSAGDCDAGGQYKDASGHYQAFVVNETNGTWGKAEEVPGTAGLNAGGSAAVDFLSCSSGGSCSAGGYYEDASDHTQVFVVNETGGTWAGAEEVPGTALLNADGYAAVDSLSCSSAGHCSAGGFYSDASDHYQAFVVNETGGTWGEAEEVPGTAGLNGDGGAAVQSLFCSSAGDCSAGGQYEDASGHYQAFVVNETGGTWGNAEEVPGTASLNAGGGAEVYSLSCSSAGSCSAGGWYYDASDHHQAFVVNETGGAWGQAEEVPGTASLNAGGDAGVSSLSCISAGNCSAGGTYEDASDHIQVFVVNETGGAWGQAEEVPGTASLNSGRVAEVNSLSCSSTGNCSAGGSYEDASDHTQPFVVNETGGAWGKAEEVPGTASLNSGGDAAVYPLFCSAAGNCSAGGYYTGASDHSQAFVVTYFPRPRVTKLSPDRGPASGGTTVTITGTNLLEPTAVHFGTAVAKVDKVISATEIKVTSPKGSGTVAVTVTSLGGTSAKTKAGRYTYFPRPRVTKLSPDRGPASGGTTVTITGTNLLEPTAVHFGTAVAKVDKVISATEIKVTSPKGSGTVAVTVTSLGGTSAKTKAGRYTY